MEQVHISTLVGEVDGMHWVQLAAITQLNMALIGSGTIAYADTDDPTLFDLFVHESYRRTGIATKLLAEAKHWADQAGKRLYLDVRPGNPVSHFYEREGFVYTGQAREDGKLWMVYTLSK